VAQSKNCTFSVITVVEFQNIKTTSDNNDIWRGVLQLTSVPVLSEVVVIFCGSIVVLITFRQILGCVTIAFSEQNIVRYGLKNI
jgi:hypothetical protein